MPTSWPILYSPVILYIKTILSIIFQQIHDRTYMHAMTEVDCARRVIPCLSSKRSIDRPDTALLRHVYQDTGHSDAGLHSRISITVILTLNVTLHLTLTLRSFLHLAALAWSSCMHVMLVCRDAAMHGLGLTCRDILSVVRARAAIWIDRRTLHPPPSFHRLKTRQKTILSVCLYPSLSLSLPLLQCGYTLARRAIRPYQSVPLIIPARVDRDSPVSRHQRHPGCRADNDFIPPLPFSPFPLFLSTLTPSLYICIMCVIYNAMSGVS